ncbi:MAG: D-glycerate dehydrogenase [Pseudomonadota bacterium]|nr:D-glycerate dehydrogenase [Pseudomonadota bacterium]|tara:strand:+ start:1628 stop:2599 length:972 start_codon:yes stop_codon:yes gene_type:complete
MDKIKVLVTRRWPVEVEEELKKKYDVTLNENDKPLTIDELKSALQNYDCLCPTVTDPINEEVLSVENKRAKIIASFGVGYNHIDIDAAKKENLVVTNTPEVLTDCTADIAMTLILSSARRTAEGERELRAGKWAGWRPTHLRGTKVTGKTLGCIGFGRIAQATADRAHFGFGMKVIFADPYKPSDEIIKKYNAKCCETIEEVLREADFVSIHCPGGESTYHLLNEERIGMMKKGAYLINSARGDVIDNDALIDALKNNKIAGAGLDVFEGEPELNEKFLELENVVLLPHLGSASIETRIAMGMRVLENMEMYYANNEPRDRVA